MKDTMEISEKVLNNNIFLLIESYLANPTRLLADKISNLSHSLTKSAYYTAQDNHPHKKISADLNSKKGSGTRFA